MATGFLQSDSYFVPFCPLISLADETTGGRAEPSQAEIDAAQAVIAYRRIEEANEAEMGEEYVGPAAVGGRI